ncbi:sigma-54-dependent Fis family transcriptional regulator [Solemya velesiana gill symbiont]|uniref:Sigma-54-dependent Fis family transcriptional regulator n=2 Tax=Solemya velesiana gill symbiont TaxID=1918948 RepID=A0A1T2KW18_9GAMM|nr:sigma-54-dependent Fis family transcriptional regulator [Solemya velesiana gill symbiont]
MLHGGCVLLVDGDEERIDYLGSIFRFLSFDFDSTGSINQVKKHLQKQDEESCFSVIVGPDVPESERSKLIQMVEQADPKPALFRVSNTGETLEEESGSPYIGAFQLPTRYEIMVNHLHKAQLFHEHQMAERGGLRPLELFRSLSGNSRATRRINKMIEQVADTEATVLVLGESGTGKEVVARKLHYNSSRRGKAFVPVNCGAIPADLLESELFGHEQGAFTGAISSRQGRFELAEGGTLFLDEIGDMSMPMQVKLLRVLQERTFERVGSSKTMRCNVRIIAATHRNLEEAIQKEKFREDLYYRLNVFPIEMPPLRDRAEDIPVLVNDLISRIEKEKRGSVRLTPGAVMALTQYRWPGNVRELANLIERLAILFPYGVVDAKDLPEKFRAGYTALSDQSEELPQVSISGDEPQSVINVSRLPHEGIDLKAHLSAMELDLIRQALDESGGVVAHAAKRLKMRRTTLVEKLRKYGLQRGQE